MQLCSAAHYRFTLISGQYLIDGPFCTTGKERKIKINRSKSGAECHGPGSKTGTTATMGFHSV